MRLYICRAASFYLNYNSQLNCTHIPCIFHENPFVKFLYTFRLFWHPCIKVGSKRLLFTRILCGNLFIWGLLTFMLSYTLGPFWIFPLLVTKTSAWDRAGWFLFRKLWHWFECVPLYQLLDLMWAVMLVGLGYEVLISLPMQGKPYKETLGSECNLFH